MAKKETVKAKKTKDAEKPAKKVAAKKVVAKKAAAPKKAAAKKVVAKKAVAKKAAKPAKKAAANAETALLDSIVEGILDRKGRNIVVQYKLIYENSVFQPRISANSSLGSLKNIAICKFFPKDY